MKISEKAKRIWKYVGYAVLALIAITAIIVIWNKWFSRTRVAFINYQATTLGEISKANNNPFVVIEELPLENLDDIDDYDMVFMNAMGIRLTEEQRDKIQMAGWTGTNILTTMSVNPDNYIVSVDSITADTLNAYLRGSSRKNYRSMLNYVRQNVDGKIIFKGVYHKTIKISIMKIKKIIPKLYTYHENPVHKNKNPALYSSLFLETYTLNPHKIYI